MKRPTEADLTKATLLDMLPPEEAEGVVKAIKRKKKGRGASYAHRPGLVLEQAYRNPKVKRWHAKSGGIDQEHFENLLKKAGKADVGTMLDAYSSRLLGFAPEYNWRFSDSGIFTPGDVQIFKHGAALAVAQDTLGVKDPEEVVAKVLGVENPEQIALRLTGTAAPALKPTPSSIIIAPHHDHLLADRGFMISTGVSVPNSGAISLLFDVVDGEVRGYLEGMFLYDKKGNGYGLSAFSSMHSWLDAITDGEGFIGLAAEQVGTYVWPLLGFDGSRDDLDDALMQLAEVETGDIKRGPGLLEYVEDLSYELGSLPEVARREHDGEKTGREALLNIYRFDYLSKNLFDTEDIYDVAERRVGSLKGEE